MNSSKLDYGDFCEKFESLTPHKKLIYILITNLSDEEISKSCQIKSHTVRQQIMQIGKHFYIAESKNKRVELAILLHENKRCLTRLDSQDISRVIKVNQKIKKKYSKKYKEELVNQLISYLWRKSITNLTIITTQVDSKYPGLIEEILTKRAKYLKEELDSYLSNVLSAHKKIWNELSNRKNIASNLYKLSMFLLDKIRKNDDLTCCGVGFKNKNNLAIERLHDGRLTQRISRKLGGYNFYSYPIDEYDTISSKPLGLIRPVHFNTLTRPWFNIQCNDLTYSEYPNSAGIDYYRGVSKPFFFGEGSKSNNAVFLTNISFSQICNFLQRLCGELKEHILITDKLGMLVATSGEEKGFIKIDNKDYGAERKKAIDSGNELTRTVVGLSLSNNNFQKPKPVSFKIGSKKYFFIVHSLQNEFASNWLVTIVISKEDIDRYLKKNLFSLNFINF